MRMKHLVPITLALPFTLLLAISGCNTSSSDTAAPASADAAATEASHEDHDHAEEPGGDQTAGDSDMEKMMEELATFSEEDRASVIKQHLCPVSGEMLGSMGAPEKIDVNGQGVWICCEGCKDKLLAEPEKYLAKLAAAQSASNDE